MNLLGEKTPVGQNRTLDSIASKASLWAIAATMALVIIFTIIAIIQEKHGQLDSENRRLSTIGGSIARSVSAEILLGDEKSVEALLTELKRQYELSELRIGEDESPSEPVQWYHSVIPASRAHRAEVLPGLTQRKLLVMEATRSRRGVFSGWLAILLIFLPLTLFGILTTLKIQKELHRSIIDPIQKLARDPENWSAEGPWVANEAVQLHERLLNYIKERDTERDKAEHLKIEASIGQMAAQVAHDIRSPLAALDMVAGLLTNVPEQKRVIIRSALSRIRDIANGLLIRNRPAPSAPTEVALTAAQMDQRDPELLSSLIEGLISEKRVQYRAKWGIEIESPMAPASYGLFARVDAGEFKRMVSSLIDHAVEALGNKGRIWTLLEPTEKSILLKVKTSNGSDNEISLPRALNPRWFVPKLSITSGTRVVILDDDSSIHQVWQGRFESLRFRENEIELIHMSNPEDLRRWHEERLQQRTLYLMDYELVGSAQTGLELIAQLGIRDCSILVTSRFEERAIRAAANGMGVRLIPKSLAGFVPVELLAVDTIGINQTTDSKVNPRHPAV